MGRLMKLCACITNDTLEDCLRTVRSIDPDLIEHRMDFLDKVDVSELGRIYKEIKVPVIATNRPIACRGNFRGSERLRIARLLEAIESGCAMVDIEIGTEEGLRRIVQMRAKEAACKVMISFHDFKRTPGKEELLRIMRNEMELGADIGKVVTMANSARDCDRVLGLLEVAKRMGFPLVAFAMGDIGRYTRIEALVRGARFMYSSIEGGLAPGQLSLKAMRKRIEELVP